MFERFLISAVIIMAAVILMLAAALVKAIADKRIWKETAAECDKETTRARARCERLDRNLDAVIEERDEAVKVRIRALNDRDAAINRADELEKKTVEYVFSGWEFIKPAEGCRDYYIEKDGIRIIVEDGKATSGWYAKKFIKEGDATELCDNFNIKIGEVELIKKADTIGYKFSKGGAVYGNVFEIKGTYEFENFVSDMNAFVEERARIYASGGVYEAPVAEVVAGG